MSIQRRAALVNDINKELSELLVAMQQLQNIAGSTVCYRIQMGVVKR